MVLAAALSGEKETEKRRNMNLIFCKYNYPALEYAKYYSPTQETPTSTFSCVMDFAYFSNILCERVQWKSWTYIGQSIHDK